MSKKSENPCDVCIIVKGTLTVVFTIVMIMAISGFYFAHITPEGIIFGSGKSSLSILALVFAIIYWTKHADCSLGIPRIQDWIILVFLIIAFISSVIGIAEIHFYSFGQNIGTMESSISIIAFATTAKYWAKHVQWMHGHKTSVYSTRRNE